MADSDRLVSTGDAARVVGVARRTLSEWARTGTIRPTLTTAGGHFRWDVADLRRQLDALRDDTTP